MKNIENMADQTRAKRIKQLILNKYTYEEASKITGITVRTMMRICNGESEPKFSDIIKIAMATNTKIDWIAHGSTGEMIEEYGNVDKYDEKEEYKDALYFLIWNLKALKHDDLMALKKIVFSLIYYNAMTRDEDLEREANHLIEFRKKKNKEKIKFYEKRLKEEYGLGNDEISNIEFFLLSRKASRY